MAQFMKVPCEPFTTDPSVSDDMSAGFDLGFMWINTTTGIAHLCMDATDGAAVWKQITN